MHLDARLVPPPGTRSSGVLRGRTVSPWVRSRARRATRATAAGTPRPTTTRRRRRPSPGTTPTTSRPPPSPGRSPGSRGSSPGSQEGEAGAGRREASTRPSSSSRGCPTSTLAPPWAAIPGEGAAGLRASPGADSTTRPRSRRSRQVGMEHETQRNPIRMMTLFLGDVLCRCQVIKTLTAALTS